MHVLYLEKTLYGSDVDAALTALRADPAVRFAEVDERRYPQELPNDPLFSASTGATGQWYLMKPSAGTASGDAAAIDAVSAWDITTGSSGTVIADIDTGVRFEHPDLLRAGFGGALLPGYDFVSGDQSSTGGALGTFLAANDGDGWDPDPSDPGDWIDASDQASPRFPSKDCPVADSSWHGTRVMGILGALTNNAVGIAGVAWNPYLLPVRALGKCGGYDSDIITGMQWAAGMSVTGIPDNPYPADIINLSLGGSDGGACPASYADVVRTLAEMGVLVVASAGNGSGAVAVPGNCPGVLAVAGLRNIGTKVGYSSFGAEVGVAAPAGNCINTQGPCLRSIDTTSNSGLKGPQNSIYTNQTQPNVGTSFSAPIVASVAALMRAVNANLTPAQLIARIKSSAAAFPQPSGIPACPTVLLDANGNPISGECACPNDGSLCGAGMVDAPSAVTSALRPIAAVSVSSTGGSAVLDASGSAASCGRTIVGYAWAGSGGVTLSAADAASTTATPSGSAAGTITLTVTDSSGAVDTAELIVAAGGTIDPGSIPAAAGSSAGACPTPLSVAPVAPIVSEAFSPATVGENALSVLTITLKNSNPFDITQASLEETLPANLALPTSAGAVPTTTCGGGGAALTSSTAAVALNNANIPAGGSCTLRIPVQSTTAGSYTASVAANALTSGPAGSNSEAAAATLTVTGPGNHGGGAVDGWDILFLVGVLLAGRRYANFEARER